MSQLGVTELFTDPDFVDPMTVVTRRPAVDGFGAVSFTEQVTRSVGCIQPASGKTVNKLPEELRVANVSSFWFKGEIIASAPGRYSSIIVFKGRRYQVQFVFDWTNWGSGYSEGTCVMEVPA